MSQKIIVWILVHTACTNTSNASFYSISIALAAPVRNFEGIFWVRSNVGGACGAHCTGIELLAVSKASGSRVDQLPFTCKSYTP